MGAAGPICPAVEHNLDRFNGTPLTLDDIASTAAHLDVRTALFLESIRSRFTGDTTAVAVFSSPDGSIADEAMRAGYLVLAESERVPGLDFAEL